VLDADVLRTWARTARVALDLARPQVDAVNVFPVADADTGTNVLLTVTGGADAVEHLPAGADATAVARAFAHGALLAARGNSGVIVSQYLAGFAAGLAPAGPGGHDVAGPLASAARAARAAVADPQEGTVLTLADVLATHAADLVREGTATGAHVRRGGGGDVPSGGAPPDVLGAVLARGHVELATISDAHPVLHREHVPDAGACALLVLLDALHRAVVGAPEPTGPPDWLPAAAPHARGVHGSGGAYEVMLVVRTPQAGASDDLGGVLRERVGAVGDSVAVVGADGVWHVHVHTDHPDLALAAADVGVREQVVVRLLDAPHGVGGDVDGGAARWGLVVCTAAPALAAWYAAAGAVVLVATPEAPVTAEHVARAVADTGAPDVALLPGGVVAADALVDHPGPVVEVLDADDELRATVAALAFATSSTAVGLHAAVRALGRLRAVRVEHADALPAGLAEVLHDAHGESLTVLHREPIDAAAAAHLDAALTGADAEHVLVGPTGSGPAFFLGLD